jgi:iron complex transport system substrate-binding protein
MPDGHRALPLRRFGCYRGDVAFGAGATRPAASPRIVSLLPSATEMVCALDAGDLLVGISHECDFPEAIRDRPVLTRSRLDPLGSSRQVDRAVRAVVGGALSIYAVDEARLGALEPDVILTQDLCEVCAVSLEDVRAAVARLAHRDQVRIVSLRPTRLDDVLGDVERVAAGIGRPSEGAALRAALVARIQALASRARLATTRPRVVSVEWIDPLMLGGTWMPELIDLAGGLAVGAGAGQPAPTVEPRVLADLRPEVIVVKPCGFSLARALAERDVLEGALRGAVGPRTRIYVTDGSSFFNRPGPRLVESLEIMAACVHPDLFEDLLGKHAGVIEQLNLA